MKTTSNIELITFWHNKYNKFLEQLKKDYNYDSPLQLLFNPNYETALHALSAYHNDLINVCGFTLGQVVEMSMFRGADKFFASLVSSGYGILNKELGYSNEQIVKIISQSDGLKNLKLELEDEKSNFCPKRQEAIKKWEDKFVELDKLEYWYARFNEVIENIKIKYQQNQNNQLKFSDFEYKNFQMINLCHVELIEKYGFNLDNLLVLIKHNAIASVYVYLSSGGYDKLRGLGYSNNDIATIALRKGGGKSLKIVHDNHESLMRIYKANNHIANMVRGCKSFEKVITFITECNKIKNDESMTEVQKEDSIGAYAKQCNINYQPVAINIAAGKYALNSNAATISNDNEDNTQDSSLLPPIIKPTIKNIIPSDAQPSISATNMQFNSVLPNLTMHSNSVNHLNNSTGLSFSTCAKNMLSGSVRQSMPVLGIKSPILGFSINSMNPASMLLNNSVPRFHDLGISNNYNGLENLQRSMLPPANFFNININVNTNLQNDDISSFLAFINANKSKRVERDADESHKFSASSKKRKL